MGRSLKGINLPWLGFVLLANVTFYVTCLNKTWSVEGWIETLTTAQDVTPALLISVLTGIINAQISPKTKARLVFWRWSHPLPGSRAFSVHAHTDPRIDTDALIQQHGPLPTDPDKQNKLWFRMYQECQERTAVKQVHGEYLFSRDWAVISVLLLVVLGPAALLQMPSPSRVLVYIAVLLAQYFLVRWAAVNHGVRFVTSVLAHKASGVV